MHVSSQTLFVQGPWASESFSSGFSQPVTRFLSQSLGPAGAAPLPVRHAVCQLQCPLGPCHRAHKVSVGYVDVPLTLTNAE